MFEIVLEAGDDRDDVQYLWLLPVFWGCNDEHSEELNQRWPRYTSSEWLTLRLLHWRLRGERWRGERGCSVHGRGMDVLR